MVKWIALALGLLILTLFVVKILKTMLKVEKDSKKTDQDVKPESEYRPEEVAVDTGSSSVSIVTDMSAKPSESDKKDSQEVDFAMPKISEGGFADDVDKDFLEYSNHMRKKGKRRPAVDFDLEGKMADEDFEYIPNSPDFSYLRNRTNKPKKPTSINELPDEIKVLMLSDLFDKKF